MYKELRLPSMSQPSDPSYEYRVGGTMPLENPNYIFRKADSQLFNSLKAGKFCYVFNARQRGKSSLAERTCQRLELEEGWTCGLIDVSESGTESLTSVEQWYKTLIFGLSKAFKISINVGQWWKELDHNPSPISRFRDFIEDILLIQIEGHILITIDEIDSLLSLKFPTDDLFIFIRSCYNKRTRNPIYNRLTFLLLGVASPPDLISDKTRTPFNIGVAVDLSRLERSDIKPLSKGIEGIVTDPTLVLDQIWKWTDGHPFLMQKICAIIQDNSLNITQGEEVDLVAEIIKKRVIENWKTQDEPEHFRTIQNRLLDDKDKAVNLLKLYQNILEKNFITVDNSQEQSDLCLSGIVTKENDKVRVTNQIYQQVFNQRWIQKQLQSLKPYAAQIKAWQESNFKDLSRLQHGNALQKSLIWADGQKLDEIDINFLETSKTHARKLFFKSAEALRQSKQEQCEEVIQTFEGQLEEITKQAVTLRQEVRFWVGLEPDLLKIVMNEILTNNEVILNGEETVKVAQAVRTEIIENWDNNLAAFHLNGIRNQLIRDRHKNRLLSLYRDILRGYDIEIDDRPDLIDLLNLGLITSDSNEENLVKVANEVYRICFSLDWIEDELERLDTTFFIRNQYRVERQILQLDSITIYKVSDISAPTTKQYEVIEFSPDFFQVDKELFDDFKKEFDDLKLGPTEKIDQVPTISSNFEENNNFYVIQESIDDKEILDIAAFNKSEEKVTSFLLEILEILKQLHKDGLSHLNLSPDYIIHRVDDGKLVLTNLDIFQRIIAKVLKKNKSGSPIVVGMDGYMAPEARVGNPSAASDLYSLGIIAIQALTGKKPAELPEDKRTQEKIWRFTTLGDRVQDISDGLVAIVDKLIQPDESDRYQSAADVIDDLKALKQKKEDEKERNKKKKWIQRGLLSLVTMGVFLSGYAISYWMASRASQRTLLRKECQKVIRLSSNDEFTALEFLQSASAIQSSCSQLIDWMIEKRRKPDADFYQRQGMAGFVQWHEAKAHGYSQPNEYLKKAEQDFSAAAATIAHSRFYQGVIAEIQNDSIDSVQYYAEAIAQYLASDAFNLSDADVPILVKLAFSLASSKNAGAEQDTVEQLMKKAFELQPSSLALQYNQAVMNAKLGNYTQSIEILKGIIHELDKENHQTEDVSLREQVYQSRAFFYIRLAASSSDSLSQSNRGYAQADLSKIVSTGFWPNYINAECATNMFLESCNLTEMINDINNDGMTNGGFPLFPMYECYEYPVLKIAEDALLETTATKLCRE